MNKKQEENDFQELCGNLVRNEIYANQNLLIEECFKKDLMFIDDIQNFYLPITETEIEYDENDEEIEKPECSSCGKPEDLDEHGHCRECQSPQEIFEWWIISDWLAEKLKEKGKPILENEYGTYWGRTTTGQAIKMDGVIREIVKDLHK